MDSAAILAFIKSLFPAFMGSVIAVWYNRNSKDSSEIKKYHILFIIFFVFFAVLLGVSVAHILGGSIIEYFNISHTSYYADLIKFFVAMSSLKIIDNSMKNADSIIEITFKGIKKFFRKWWS